MDSGDLLEPAVRCVEENLEKYFEWEMKAVRPGEPDGRVDVCLYLLPPTGHSLKKHDIEALKRLQVTLNLQMISGINIGLFRRSLISFPALRKLTVSQAKS